MPARWPAPRPRPTRSQRLPSRSLSWSVNGFGGSKEDQSGAAQALGREGYVTLSYTGLGFPNGGCKISLDDPAYDGKAARQLVDYLAGLKADNSGRVLDQHQLQ